MKEIPLTQGKAALVDNEDYERLSKFKWCAVKYRKNFYAVRNVRMPGGKWRLRFLHQEVLPPKDGFITDHKHGQTLDNRKSELRYATYTENQRNQSKRRDGVTSQFRGVHWRKDRGCFCAQIKINGRNTHLGFLILSRLPLVFMT